MRVRGMLCVLGALAVSGSTVATESGESIAKKAAKGNVKAPVLQMRVQREGQMVTLPRTLPFLSAGTIGCSGRDSNGNKRVNQDCTFRRQAEETITFNPLDANNLLAGQNDSRVGFNQCGIDWSMDNGNHWGDLLPPFRQKLNNPAGQEPIPSDPNRHTILGDPGTNHTYDV